jgi:2-haloacid dehalogenase
MTKLTATKPYDFAIIFDFGGVLLDWDPRYLYRKFFEDDLAGMEHFLTDIDFMEWNRHQDRGRSFSKGVEVLSQRFPQYADLIRAYHRRWEESIAGPIDTSVEILSKLKRAGYPLYGLSNFSIEKFEITRRKYPFLNLFDDILLSAEVGLLKPDRRIFQHLLDRIDYRATGCIFIDDSPANVSAAKHLGFHAIEYRDPEQLRAALMYLLNGRFPI